MLAFSGSIDIGRGSSFRKRFESLRLRCIESRDEVSAFSSGRIAGSLVADMILSSSTSLFSRSGID